MGVMYLNSGLPPREVLPEEAGMWHKRHSMFDTILQEIIIAADSKHLRKGKDGKYYLAKHDLGDGSES